MKAPSQTGCDHCDRCQPSVRPRIHPAVSVAQGWERRGGAADVSLLTVIRLPVRAGLVVESGAVIGRRAQVAGTQRQRGQLLWMAECGKVTAGTTGGDAGVALLRESVTHLAGPCRLEYARALVDLGAALRRGMSGNPAATREPWPPDRSWLTGAALVCSRSEGAKRCSQRAPGRAASS